MSKVVKAARIGATPFIVIRVSQSMGKVNGVHLSPGFFALVAGEIAGGTKPEDVDVQAICIPDNGRGEAPGCPETHDANSSQLIEQELKYLGDLLAIPGTTATNRILEDIEALDWRVRDQRVVEFKTTKKLGTAAAGSTTTPSKKSHAVLE